MAFKLARRLTNATVAAGVLGIAGLVYSKDSRSAIHEYVILPAIRNYTDAETSHRLAIDLLKYPFLSPREPSNWDSINDPNGKLHVTLFGKACSAKHVRPLHLVSPIGVAAGLDKHGEAIDSLFNFGFSWVEVGSVTPEPQSGNPLPRFFRLDADKAVINRYGFNSDGHLAVLARLQQRLIKNYGKISPSGKALAINLGKNKNGDEINDYVLGVKRFAQYADVLVINVSSPNTPGLRALQGEQKLTNLLKTVISARNELPLTSVPPIVVKIAPDLNASEVESIARSITESKIDGVIVSNTTVQRPESLVSDKKITNEVGGLSGRPLKPYSLSTLKLLKADLNKLNNTWVNVIGCGGISNYKDAQEFHSAGADFVEIYTAFAYKGPALANEIKQGLLNNGGW